MALQDLQQVTPDHFADAAEMARIRDRLYAVASIGNQNHQTAVQLQEVLNVQNATIGSPPFVAFGRALRREIDATGCALPTGDDAATAAAASAAAMPAGVRARNCRLFVFNDLLVWAFSNPDRLFFVRVPCARRAQ